MLSLAGDRYGKRILAEHYDLAGRYSLKALSAETQARDLADALPPAINASRINRSAKADSDA